MPAAIHDRFAEYYDKLHHFKDYGAQATVFAGLVRERHPAARSLLDVACGTGLFTEALGRHFSVDGMDISAPMLARARRRLPDVHFIKADMTGFDMQRRYDVVACLFSSIVYVRTIGRLNDAVAAMAAHLAPGGVLAVEPFFPPEKFRAPCVYMNLVQEDALKIAWIYNQTLVDGEAQLHYHITAGTPERVEHFEEVHRLGLFTDDDYRSAFSRLGLACEYLPGAHAGRGLYLAWQSTP